MGNEPNGPLGPEVKAMNLPKPGKYGGQDDMEKFDNWLTHLLKYFRTFKITGYGRDGDHVLYMCQDRFFTDLISTRGLGVRGWSSGKTEMLCSVVALPK